MERQRQLFDEEYVMLPYQAANPGDSEKEIKRRKRYEEDEERRRERAKRRAEERLAALEHRLERADDKRGDIVRRSEIVLQQQQLEEPPYQMDGWKPEVPKPRSKMGGFLLLLLPINLCEKQLHTPRQWEEARIC